MIVQKIVTNRIFGYLSLESLKLERNTRYNSFRKKKRTTISSNGRSDDRWQTEFVPSNRNVFINGAARYGIVGNIVIAVASNDVIVARYSWRPRHSHYPRLIYTAAVLQVARGRDGLWRSRCGTLSRDNASIVVIRVCKKVSSPKTWGDFWKNEHSRRLNRGGGIKIEEFLKRWREIFYSL